MAITPQKQIRDNLSRLIRQPDGDSLKLVDDGSYVAVVKFVCDWRQVMDLMPRRYTTKHPDFPNLLCSDIQVGRKPPGIAELTVTYAGLPHKTTTSSGTGEFEPIEEMARSTRQEPIETHPDFSTWKEASRVQLDSDGQFKGFVENDDLYGIRDYLAGGGTYRRTYVSRTAPAALTVGSIEDSPTGAPTVSGSYDWLVVGQTWQRKGGVYSVTENYLLSGPAGWNSEVYDG